MLDRADWVRTGLKVVAILGCRRGRSAAPCDTGIARADTTGPGTARPGPSSPMSQCYPEGIVGLPRWATVTGLLGLVVLGLCLSAVGQNAGPGTTHDLLATECGFACVTTAAPPTVICGNVLSRSAAGIVVYTIWGRDAQGIVRYPTAGNVVYLRVSKSCSGGSEVQIRPTGILRVVRSVRTSDRRLAMVVLAQVRPGLATITATRHGHLVGRIRIELRPEPPPPSP
jgi:hypothetical protein